MASETSFAALSMRRALRLALAVQVLVLARGAEAQDQRLHLGRRLQLVERAWNARGCDAGKSVVEPAFESAVAWFFTGRYAEAGRVLDRARFELAHEREPSPLECARLALDLVPRLRLLPASATSLEVDLRSFYEVAGASAELEALHVEWRSAAGAILAKEPAAEELRFRAPEGGWTEGDHSLVLVGEKGAELGRITVSIAANLESRLAALRATAGTGRGIAARSLQLGEQNLRSLAVGGVLEVDLRATAELAKLEALARRIASGAAPFAAEGDWLLDLGREGEPALPARFYAPAPATSAAPLPLVVALHGMGGSEHVFFEASGAGRIVALVKQRGWLLVAPRVSGAADLVERTIDAVAEIRSVDRTRIFLLGHSMGAMRAGAAAERDPSRYRAVALFGGAGRVHDAAKLAHIGFWIGVGTRDFARRGAVAYARALEGAHHPSVVLRELEGVEHYTVLQLGLDEAFAYFDSRARGDG